jgi:hypothetical protein
MVALSLVVLLAFMGLAIDVGALYHVKRIMQTAADAGALAGANEILRGNTLGINSSAQGGTKTNGFTDGVNGVTVTVNNPPASGYYVGQPSYVEVMIKQNSPTYFMKILGYQSVAILSRAVAGTANSKNCIYVMDPSKIDALFVESSTLSSTCGVTVDSKASEAMLFNGICNVTVPVFDITGGYTDSACPPQFQSAPSKLYTGVPPAADPLLWLSPPSRSGLTVYPQCCALGQGRLTTKLTLNPGVYNGGIILNGVDATFNPGVYILNGGGLTMIESLAHGTGVTFYNTFDATHSFAPIHTTGDGAWQLSAPPVSSGTPAGTVVQGGALAGILFFEDRNAPTGFINEFDQPRGPNTLTGAIYFPRSGFILENETEVVSGVIVAQTVVLGGISTLIENYDTSNNTIKRISLVE